MQTYENNVAQTVCGVTKVRESELTTTAKCCSISDASLKTLESIWNSESFVEMILKPAASNIDWPVRDQIETPGSVLVGSLGLESEVVYPVCFRYPVRERIEFALECNNAIRLLH